MGQGLTMQPTLAAQHRDTRPTGSLVHGRKHEAGLVCILLFHEKTNTITREMGPSGPACLIILNARG